ncbi:MAG: hypothetical protein ACREIA_02580 [Opitutaceae bacterium]
MSNAAHKPGSGNFWISTLAIIGCFLIFAVVLYIAKLPSSRDVTAIPENLTPEERLERNILSPGQRKERLAELHAKERSAATSYGWIDQAAGVVRLPVDRAMELTVRDLRQPQPQASR